MAFTEALRIAGVTASQAGLSLRETVSTISFQANTHSGAELLEENAYIEERVAEHMAEQLARDMEHRLIFGDTEDLEDSPPVDGETVRRADLAVNDLTQDGGMLTPEQSENFVRTLIDGRSLLSEVREVPLKGRDFYMSCFIRARKLKLTGG